MMNGDPLQTGKAGLIQRDDVRAELKISAKQREQIDEEQKKAMEAMRANRIDFQALRDLAPEERQAKMQEFREKMQSQMKLANDAMLTKMQSLLTPEQAKRLDEIDLQQRGPLALGDDNVSKKMNLTPDQEREIGNIIGEYRTGQQEIMKSFQPPAPAPGGGGQPPQFDRAAFQARMEQMRKDTEKLRKESGDKVVALLTGEQKQTWKTLLGKPFTLRTKAPNAR